MKCKNCAANYKTRELKCPYCNTENLMGKLWQVERTQAELEYENEKKKIGKILLSPYMYERLLNRTLVVTIGVYILSFLVIVLIFMLAEPLEKLHFSANKDKIEATMEKYFTAGEYEQLDVYMDENFVELKDYYAYAQATSIQFSYNQYMKQRLAFQALTEEEKLTDEYHLEYALKDSVKVYILDFGIFSDLDEENRELCENYQKEIMAYWTGCLGLSEEQIDELVHAEYYNEPDFETIMQDIKNRRSWQ